MCQNTKKGENLALTKKSCFCWQLRLQYATLLIRILLYIVLKNGKITNFAFSTFMAYKIYPQLMCKVCAFCVVTMRTVENVIMYVDSVCVEGFHVCSDVHCKLCVFYIELQFFTRQSG